MDETPDPNAPRRPPEGAAPPPPASPPAPTISQPAPQPNAPPAYGQPFPPQYPAQPFYAQQVPPAYPPQAYGQQPPAGYWQQPAYGYAPQPGYGQPMPYGYYGVPAPMAVREPDHSTSTFAGVLWVLLLVRNLVMIPVIFAAGVLLFFFTIGFGVALWILIIFPVIGIAGCAMAMASDFQRKNHTMGTIGAVMALVGSSFPGPFFGFGIVGMVLGVIGLALHLAARKEWK